jgi:PAS domain S-box-containing protein
VTPFRDLPLHRKLALTIVVTSAFALLLMSAAFLIYEWRIFRTATLTNLVTLSRIIADNSAPAVSSRNMPEAREIVEALKAEKDIVSAAIYDLRGERMAYYSTTSRLPPATVPAIPANNHLFGASHLVVFEPISEENRRLGTLMIESGLAAMQQRFVLYSVIVLAILGTSSLVAFAFSSQIQRRITAPIQDLARTAQAITERNDYSIRATRHGNDELGALTDAFNRMLDEIKEREQRLSASEERLLVALGAADMGTWRYYPARSESVVDDNFRRIYGLQPGNAPAKDSEIAARIYPEDRDRVRAALDQALKGSEPYAFEYRLGSPDGLRWVRDRGRVVRRPDGSVDYLTGAIVDITEHKQAEEEIRRLNADLELRVAQRTTELEHANREMEAFAYSVSHDLRGPLRHISGYVEIIHDDPDSRLSPQVQSCLNRMGNAATRLSRLVDSLLNLGHVGRRQLVLQRTRLDDLVTAALRELEPETKNRRIEWQRQRLPTVDCDPSLMHTVFVNLLSNALKYSRPRDPAIIHIGMNVENGQTEIVVRDNGVGFDPRTQDKLFAVFERLHSATAFEGNGIGLATVDRIIRKHGGRIWAKAEVDKGATFSFTFPGL